MPLFGLGVWSAQSGKETFDAVFSALKTGYRHIDTAEMYGNEKDVGNAVIDSGLIETRSLLQLSCGIVV